MRFMLKASRRTPTWWKAVETHFVDATDEASAREMVELDPQLEVWDCIVATNGLEAAYHARVAKCEAWIVLARTASARRGML